MQRVFFVRPSVQGGWAVSCPVCVSTAAVNVRVHASFWTIILSTFFYCFGCMARILQDLTSPTRVWSWALEVTTGPTGNALLGRIILSQMAVHAALCFTAKWHVDCKTDFSESNQINSKVYSRDSNFSVSRDWLNFKALTFLIALCVV